MRHAAAIVWALLGAVAFPPAATASPGDLDGSFSEDGWLRTLEVRSSDNNYLPRGAEDVAIQPDGRIVEVGEMIEGPQLVLRGVPLAQLVDEVDESWARILGSVLVLLVGTTVLAPLLRGLQPAAARRG